MESKIIFDRQTDRQTDISFCIPVYNVKKYLDKCIQSIVCQNFNLLTYEILLVDDCSNDGSYEYLLDMAKDFPEMRVLKNSKNGGISYTRNRLIEEAKGSYIWFVDSDDMLFPGAFRALYDIIYAEKADVLIANYIKIRENDNVITGNSVQDFAYSQPDMLDFSWLSDEMGESRMKSVWRGIFSKKFLDENELRFKENIVFKEDVLFYYEFCMVRPKILKCEMPCYCYRQRSTSVMHNLSERKKKNVCVSTIALIEQYQKLINQECLYIFEITKLIGIEKENVVMGLVRVKDTNWVRNKLRELKSKGLYPYSFNKQALKSNASVLIKLINYLLPIEIIFWIFHYIYKISRAKN